MKKAILTGVMITGLFLTSCSRYSYHETSVTDKNGVAIRNVNNIFN